MESLIDATHVHAVRRLEEMEAARDLLIEAGVPATMTEATIALLRRFIEGGTTQGVPGTDESSD
jgi:hypothetical protein